MQWRYCAFNGSKWLIPVRAQRRHGIQQTSRIWMRRRPEDCLLGGKFHQIACIHDCYMVGDLRDHRQIMGYEQNCQSEAAPEIGEQFEYLCLDSDVQCGGRLVGDQQLGAIHNRYGDHDSLTHAARELMRIVAGQWSGSKPLVY